MFFDDLKEDHTGCVRHIAKFMGVDCDEEAIARVVHTTSHAEMARHSSKFDVSRETVKIAKMLGEDPPTEYYSKVCRDGGRSGDDKLFLLMCSSISRTNGMRLSQQSWGFET